jgi:hypothetical protein
MQPTLVDGDLLDRPAEAALRAGPLSALRPPVRERVAHRVLRCARRESVPALRLASPEPVKADDLPFRQRTEEPLGFPGRRPRLSRHPNVAPLDFRNSAMKEHPVRHLLLAAALLFSTSVSAHDDELPIDNSTQLRDWCKAKSEAHFVGQGRTPYNWTARDVERGNALFVDGKWRVDGEYFSVTCNVARGAQRQYAKFQVARAP